jgi:hypothetical protein
MKKYYLLLFILFSATTQLVAQNGNVVVTTNLTDVISLTIAVPTAAIIINSADHYQNGTSTVVPAALLF